MEIGGILLIIGISVFSIGALIGGVKLLMLVVRTLEKYSKEE